MIHNKDGNEEGVFSKETIESLIELGKVLQEIRNDMAKEGIDLKAFDEECERQHKWKLQNHS